MIQIRTKLILKIDDNVEPGLNFTFAQLKTATMCQKDFNSAGLI